MTETDTITKGKRAGQRLREGQVKVKSIVAQTKKRIIAVNAPTGSGKSIMAVESMPEPLYYLCPSKALQDQIEDEYPEAVVLKGRGNYVCSMYGTADGCLKRPKSCDELCAYEEAKEEALRSRFTVMNFHYFLIAANYVKMLNKDRWGKRNVVVDEADVLEPLLTDFVSFFVPFNLLQACNLPVPDKKTVISSFYSIIPTYISTFTSQLRKLNSLYEHVIDAKQANDIARKIRRLEEMKKKLERIVETPQNLWVYLTSDSGVECKIKWLQREMVDELLLDHGERWMFMSATLPAKPLFCTYFQFDPEEVEYIELPSVFPVENRLVVYRPVTKVTKKTEDGQMRKLVGAVEEIIRTHEGKGLIHTVSYKLSREIEKIRDKRIITHTPSNFRVQYEKFLRSDDCIFVSPVALRGLDLHDDLVRWIVFTKVPYLNLDDILVSTRLYGFGKLGRLWYAGKAVENIIQGCGRGVRHETDWCKTYILDEEFGRLMREYTFLFPLWFREALVYE